jgi:hypothetical protein
MIRKPGISGFFCFKGLQHVIKQTEKELFYNMQIRLFCESFDAIILILSTVKPF